MPMERDRYAENWRSIHLKKKQAANWQCEDCGRHCRKRGEDVAMFFERTGYDVADICDHPQRYTLTVAHLNQKPEDNSDENLRALCTGCHLKHDRRFQERNRYEKRERRGQMNLLKPLELVPPARWRAKGKT